MKSRIMSLSTFSLVCALFSVSIARADETPSGYSCRINVTEPPSSCSNSDDCYANTKRIWWQEFFAKGSDNFEATKLVDPTSKLEFSVLPTLAKPEAGGSKLYLTILAPGQKGLASVVIAPSKKGVNAVLFGSYKKYAATLTCVPN